MSAASDVDEGAARAIQTGRETLGALLGSAQKRLQKVFIVFLVGMLGGIFAMRLYIWPHLRADLLPTEAGASIIAQTPFDVILLQVKIGLLTGVLLAVPALLFFSRDVLRERGVIRAAPISKTRAAAVAGLSALLFVGGVTYAYDLFFPLMFKFLAGNATSAGFAPMYSIVSWTQFILVLGLSFGLAAQMPLAMTALSYSGVVPYEFFRDNWKYAIVIMFAFGAVFSPPDPFTQILWALPLVGLYGFSLYLSKLVVTAKRGSEHVDIRGQLLARWNRVLGVAFVVGAAAYLALDAGLVAAVNGRVLPAFPAAYRPGPVPTPAAALGLSPDVAPFVAAGLVGLVGLVVAVLYYVYAVTESAARSIAAGAGAPEHIDLSALDAEGVRAAPPEAFDDLSEADALAIANEAMDRGDPERARAVLDRFDDAEDARAESGEGGDAGGADGDGEDGGGIVSGTTTGMINAFSQEGTTEEEIGGYFYDIAFIIDSLRSRLFRVAALFMVVLAGTFGFLYQGGIGVIREDFLSRVPEAVRPEGMATNWPITLHPVEALVFEVKISTIFAVIVTLPVVAYYVWPAVRERGWAARGDRRTFLVWGGSLLAGLALGIYVGYTYVAPFVLSWLVTDALKANMVIAYRVKAFFWLVFLTTAGIGILMDIPVTMLLFHYGRIVSYRVMRERWRGVAVAAFAFSAVATPESVYTLFLIAVPIILFYWLGLGVLWALTLGGRRDPSRTA